MKNNEMESLESCDGVVMLPVTFGKASDGEIAVRDLARLPHLLIGGVTGSGKSGFLHSLVCSLVQNHSPEQVRFVLMDTKCVEFCLYEKLPHLYSPVIRETESHESDNLGRVSIDRRVVESVKNRLFQVDNASFKTENIESISHEENLGFCYMTDYVWTKETIKVTCLNEPELGSTILSNYFNRIYYPTFEKVGDIKEYFNEGVPILGTSSLSYNFEGGYDGWDDGDGTKWNNHPINGKICEFKEKDKYVVIFYIIRDDNKDVYVKLVFNEGEEMTY